MSKLIANLCIVFSVFANVENNQISAAQEEPIHGSIDMEKALEISDDLQVDMNELEVIEEALPELYEPRTPEEENARGLESWDEAGIPVDLKEAEAALHDPFSAEEQAEIERLITEDANLDGTANLAHKKEMTDAISSTASAITKDSGSKFEKPKKR